MDTLKQNLDTPAWVAQVWISFVAALGTTACGIWYLPVDGWVRGFMWLGLFFTVASSFTLAKTLRDNHEAQRLINRVKGAKTERLIREYEKSDEAS